MSAKTDDQLSEKTVAFQIIQFLQAFKEKNEASGADIDSACRVHFLLC